MLCLLCNNDIFQGDELKCSKCKGNLNFTCACLREANVRKLARLNRDKWCCAKCKLMVFNTNIKQDDDYFVDSNEILSN